MSKRLSVKYRLRCQWTVVSINRVMPAVIQTVIATIKRAAAKEKNNRGLNKIIYAHVINKVIFIEK